MKGVLGGVLPVFPAQEEYKESLNVDLSPAVSHLGTAGSPAASKLLAPDQATAVAVWGKADRACFLEKPLSHEVLLTITFPLQGCLVLPPGPWACQSLDHSWAVPSLGPQATMQLLLVQ